MNSTIPTGAAILLDFIAGFESKGDYTVIFGDHATPKPITSMTLAELMANQRVWGVRWGSSAAGRYQFLRMTLQGLVTALGLKTSAVFTPDLQDLMAYQLLRQRGYARFKSGSLTTVQFARSLAQEWASLPVLEGTMGAHRKIARGETYYAGDRLNRALISPEKFEAVLAKALAAA